MSTFVNPSTRTRSRKFAMTFVVGALAVVVSLTTAGQAHSSPDDSIDIAPLAPADVLGLEESTGLSAAEVESRFSGQNEFAIMLADVAAQSPDAYFSSEWVGGEDTRARVAFHGRPSEDVLKALESLPFPVDVSFDAPATLERLLAFQEDISKKLASLPGIEYSSSEFDPKSGVLALSYAGIGAEVELAVSQLLEHSQDFLVPVVATAVEASSIAFDGHVVRGGVSISGCTTAFAVFAGATRGVLTAGHCSDGSPSVFGSAYPAVFQGEHEGSYGDFQWHRTVDTTSNQIRISSSGTLRTITSNGYTSTGMGVCNYGKTRTTANCTTVAATNICGSWTSPDAGPVTLCRLMRTNTTITNPGDSGGPWYFNNTAYGIHFGTAGGSAAYSTVYNAQSILGILLKIS